MFVFGLADLPLFRSAFARPTPAASRIPDRLPCRLMVRGANKTMARLTGRWRIVEMSNWDRDAIDLVGPGG